MGGEPLPRGGREWRRRRGQALSTLATRQYGIVSVEQLYEALGYSDDEVRRAVEAGHLQRLYRGVYLVGHRRIEPIGRCLAAVFASGPGALLSHYSAGWLWGLGVPSPVPVHVTSSVPRAPRGDIRRHRARNLVDEDATVHEGVAVTSVPRVLLDLAALAPPDRLDRYIERSEQRKLFDLRPVESVLARNRGHRGAARLHRALAIYRPSPFTRSDLEREFLKAARAGRLPTPRVNFVEAGFELDMYWPEHRFVVELDVFETHGSQAAFERDRLRQEDLLLLGIGMTRVTGPRLGREPRQVIERVRRLLLHWSPDPDSLLR